MGNIFRGMYLEAELNVGAAFLQKKLPSHSTLETVTKEMLQFKDAFPYMYSVVCSCFDYWIINCNVREQLLHCH